MGRITTTLNGSIPHGPAAREQFVKWGFAGDDLDVLMEGIAESYAETGYVPTDLASFNIELLSGGIAHLKKVRQSNG